MAKKAIKIKIRRGAAATSLPYPGQSSSRDVGRKRNQNTPDFFYDEPIKDVNQKPSEFPPEGSDAWVVARVQSALSSGH